MLEELLADPLPDGLTQTALTGQTATNRISEFSSESVTLEELVQIKMLNVMHQLFVALSVVDILILFWTETLQMLIVHDGKNQDTVNAVGFLGDVVAMS